MQRTTAVFLALRPHQWVKNLFVAAPILFSKQLFDGFKLGRGALAVAIFCMLSGTVYIINDLVDVEQDRVHPRKSKRPIASGALPMPMARTVAFLLGGLALLSSTLLGVPFVLAATSYFLLNLAYCFLLKHIVFLDVASISMGFLLRVIAGALAVRVRYSPWLLVCTGFLACFLGLGKRAHELATSGERAEAQRKVLARYRLNHLRIALPIVGIATVVAYVLYTLSPHTINFFGSSKMVLTAPFIVFGIFRFNRLMQQRPAAESPTEEMLRDPLFLANLGCWVLAVTYIIYGS